MAAQRRVYAAVLGVIGLFVAIQLGALALVEPFLEAELQAVEDPTDPTNSVLFFGVLILATAGMLVAFRYGGQRAIRAAIVLVSGYLTWLVVDTLFGRLLEAAVGGTLSGPISVLAVGVPVLAGLGIIVGLTYYPEWYLIDAAGIVLGAGAAGIFGTSFGPFPALVFLTVLAVYDALSVYGTKHMLTLAEGMMNLNVPVLLVVPTVADYSFVTDEGPESTAADGDPAQRSALYIGLGDAVMPTILVASAATFFPDVGALSVPGLALNLPALGAMIGTVLGLLALMTLVLKGRPHAGLPLLNGGAIIGYLVAALAAGLSVSEAVGWPF